MGKGLFFFCCSCCILILTIINFSIGPIVSLSATSDWGVANCAKKKDDYKRDKDNGVEGDELKYGSKWNYDLCIRQKGMHDMEYTSFIFDIVIGFVCGLLGLLHYFDLKKDFVVNTGLIGLVCGAVGFVLTFVYVIFNGLIFTNMDAGLKRDGDNAYAEKDANTNSFKCLYYDEKNPHKARAKISDLNKKQYNYNKDLYLKLHNGDCTDTSYTFYCTSRGYSGTIPTSILSVDSECKFLYYRPETEITNKDVFNRMLTALILSLIVCLANIGLALFGFLLFRTPGDF